MMYARAIPAALSADQLQRITAEHGYYLPSASIIAIKDLDTFDALCHDLACDGTTLELVEEHVAIGPAMSAKELEILSLWYRDEAPRARGS